MIDNHTYTPSAAAANEQVKRDLRAIIGEFRTIADGTYVLTGSFGRGEGTVRKVDGEFRAVNDYDFVFVPDESRPGPQPELASRTEDLADQLSVDFVDIDVFSRAELGGLSPSIFNYDLRYGSVVVHGDDAVIEEIPAFGPEAIPLYEAVILLTNRMAGLLGGVVEDRSDRYVLNQLQKLRLAWADSLLLTESRYSASYREKAETCQSLLERDQLGGIEEAPAIRQNIDDAISFKLAPSYDRAVPSEDIETALRRTHIVFKIVLETLLEARFESPWDAYGTLATHDFDPHVRIFNAFRLWRDGLLSPVAAVRAAPWASESQIRASIVLTVHGVVTGEQPLAPPPFFRHAVGVPPTSRAAGEQLYAVWNCLYH